MKMTCGLAASTISVSKFPSMPIFTIRPSFTRWRISSLNRFFVPVSPFTTSWASRIVKFDSCKAVMQMVLVIGTRTFVYPSGTATSSEWTKAKWYLPPCLREAVADRGVGEPTSTSRTSAESRTLNPVAYFTSMLTAESVAPSPVPLLVLAPFPEQALANTATAAIPSNSPFLIVRTITS